MAFSTVTLSHTFQNMDGSSASGTVTFRLTKRMSNGTTTILPTEITVTLDGSGHFSQTLTANNDPTTTPLDASYICTIRIPPAQLQEYSIIIPTAGGSVDLATLLPSTPTGG